MGVNTDEADLYAEGLRRWRGRQRPVPDADASRLQAALDSSAVKIADRAALYRKSGWTSSTQIPNRTRPIKLSRNGRCIGECGEGRRDAMVGIISMLAHALIYAAAFPSLQGRVNWLRPSAK